MVLRVTQLKVNSFIFTSKILSFNPVLQRVKHTNFLNHKRVVKEFWKDIVKNNAISI